MSHEGKVAYKPKIFSFITVHLPVKYDEEHKLKLGKIIHIEDLLSVISLAYTTYLSPGFT